MSDDLDPDVRRFVLDRVDAIELLEVLLALRSAREAVHTPDSLSRALGSSPRSIAGRLAALQALGLAQRPGDGWRYAAAAPLDDLIARVERAYRERRLTVINLIYAPEASDLQAFSDAFRLRPKKEDQR